MFWACFTQVNVQEKAFWSFASIGYSGKVWTLCFCARLKLGNFTEVESLSI